MIRRHVLAALAAGVRAGDDDVARAALAKIDWILRGRARSRLERRLIDAQLACGSFAAPDHVMMHAALAVAHRAKGIGEATDRAVVEAAYGKLALPAISRAPIATTIATAAALAIGVLAVWMLVVRPTTPARSYDRPLPPPVAGAFEHGGVPLADPAIEKTLVEQLTDYVLVVDADRNTFGKHATERKASAARLRTAPAVQRTPALAAAWAQLIDGFDRWVTIPVSSPDFQTVADELRSHARAVSDQLAALGLGYYLEGDVFASGDSAHAAVYTYRIVEVMYVTVQPGEPRRVLDLRRLDQLSISHGLLGMESTALGDPLVLLDRIDEHVATVVLPVLAPGAEFPLAGTWQTEHEARWEDPGKLAIASGDAVRRELVAALGAKDGEAATRIAALLVERAALLESWKDALASRNLRMSRVTDLFLPAGFADELHGKVPGAQLDRLVEIEDTLARDEAPRIASRLLELVATSTRHHEAQHGVDDARADKLRYPDALAEHLGAFENQKGEPRPAAEHANAELSAYVSQIANDPQTPQLALWSMARHAFTQHRWGTAESYVAVLALDGIARHLGIGAHEAIIHDGMIDRTRLSAIAEGLPKRSGDELRAAARALWAELYGEPLVTIRERSATLGP